MLLWGISELIHEKCFLHLGSLLRWCSGTESACQWRRRKRHWFDPWIRKIPQRRTWQPTPVFLPRESHRQRSLVGCSPRRHRDADTTGHKCTCIQKMLHIITVTPALIVARTSEYIPLKDKGGVHLLTLWNTLMVHDWPSKMTFKTLDKWL